MKKYYPLGTPPEFAHSGDYGDTIFSLATVKAVGGADQFILSCDPSKTTAPMTEAHAEVLEPLLRAQPYIGDVLWSPAPTGSSLDGWRDHLRDYPNSIASHAATKGWGARTSLLEKPWLVVPSADRQVRYVFVRTERTRGQDTHWHEIVRLYGKEAVFLGLKHEHEAFVGQFGFVHWRQTKDFLEAARIIAGCDVFFGNQTSLHAIAVGLGKPIVREAPDQHRLDNSRFFRQNELSVYRGESVSDSAIQSLIGVPTTTTFQRRAVPIGYEDACWIGDHYWHRYNMRDLLSEDTYGFKDRLANLDFTPTNIVDVGGFIGLASWAMTRLWPEARITIYEPNTDTANLLWLNNPNATIVPAAVHPNERWLAYSRGTEDPGCNHCHGDSRRLVSAVWLDESQPIDVLKMDCEGGEWAILENLHRLTQLPRLIFGEYHGPHGPQRLADLLGDKYRLEFREGHAVIGIFWANRL